MNIRKEAVGFVLNELISLGRKRIRGSEKGEEVISTIKEQFGYEVTAKDNAQQVLASIREPLMDSLDEFARKTGEGAISAIEAMEPQVAKRTFLQCYGELGGQAKFVVWLLVLFCTITTTIFNYNVYVADVANADMQLLGFVVPFVTLVALCVLPVKTVAYTALSLGSKVISSRMAK